MPRWAALSRLLTAAVSAVWVASASPDAIATRVFLTYVFRDVFTDPATARRFAFRLMSFLLDLMFAITGCEGRVYPSGKKKGIGDREKEEEDRSLPCFLVPCPLL